LQRRPLYPSITARRHHAAAVCRCRTCQSPGQRARSNVARRQRLRSCRKQQREFWRCSGVMMPKHDAAASHSKHPPANPRSLRVRLDPARRFDQRSLSSTSGIVQRQHKASNKQNRATPSKQICPVPPLLFLVPPPPSSSPRTFISPSRRSSSALAVDSRHATSCSDAMSSCG
jgi:hypothetical protein